MMFTAQKAQTHTRSLDGVKVPDWDFVEKVVAQSEPPRLTDIPQHIKFLKKFGGGCSLHLIRQSLEYLESRMPEGRIVSGNFFDVLCKVKLAPHEQMVRLVYGCLFLQALGPDTREAVGSTVTEGNVRSLGTYNKEAGLQAEQMLNKAHAVLNAIPDDAPRKSLLASAPFDMAMECARFIFDVDSQYESLEAISSAFVRKMVDDSSSSQKVAAQGELDTDDCVIEFATDGSSNAGAIHVRQAGFKVKTICELKKSHATKPSDCRESQFEIAYINDDGSVGMRTILPDGSADETVAAVSMGTLFLNYKIVKQRIELYPGYPSNCVSRSEEMADARTRGAIAIALALLDEEKDKIKFRCQSKPCSRLFALEAVASRGLRLVPLTPSIDKAKKEETKKTQEGGEAKGKSEDVIKAIAEDKSFILKKCVSKTCVGEFWVMRSTHIKEDSNMVLENTSVIAKDPFSKWPASITVPCAVNHVPVRAGDEVVLFKPKDPKDANASPPKTSRTPKRTSPPKPQTSPGKAKTSPGKAKTDKELSTPRPMKKSKTA